MAKIVIDARESGTSTGRYVDKLVEYLSKFKTEHAFVVLTKPHRLKFLQEVAPGFETIESPYKEFTFGEQLGFLRQLNGQYADLVHFTMTQQPVSYHGRVVTTIHDLTTARFINATKQAVIFKSKQLVYRRVINKVARKSRVIITPSEFVKDDVAQYTKINPAKIQVIYEAADRIKEEAEPMGDLSGTDFLLYVGRPQPHKNLRRLIEAYSELKWQYPKLWLVLAGKLDDNYQLLQKYVAGKKVSDVIFTDFVTEGELRWLYENASAYIFPSLSEGFGLPGLEAMQHGLPVVSSHATALPEVYKDAALYFDPLSTKGMAAKIDELLKDNRLAKSLVEKGHKVAASYSWQHMAEETLAVYNKVLTGKF